MCRETPSDDDFLKRLLDLKIEAKPGTKWDYSNTNYWLLARVIEEVSGMSSAQFMQERIFTPLGMTATRTALPNQTLMGRAAGYRLVNGRLENREAIQPHTGRGLGDIATTVADMARWEQEQRQPRLLKPETAALAHQAVALDDGSATTYGYGWFTDQILSVPTLGHSGQTAGFVANYVRVPSRDLAIVLLTNLYGAPGGITRLVRLVEPSLSGPPLLPAANADAKWNQRVREFAAAAAQAQSGWREEWFTSDLWRGIRPNLLDIEATYRRRGTLQSVTAVGPGGVQDTKRPSYRVVFENMMARVISFEFDEEGRMKSIRSEDE